MKKNFIAVYTFLVFSCGLFADGLPLFKIVKLDSSKQTITIQEINQKKKPVGKQITVKIVKETQIQNPDAIVQFKDLKIGSLAEIAIDDETKTATHIYIK